MGRRPNQLVLEYFQRGRKLEDSSNRYEHTCKRCGEVFPKGRVDSLMAHILRRCPNVVQQDRERVYQFMQSEGRKAQTARKTPAKDHGSISSLPINNTPQPYQSDLPFPLFQQQQSALDTLAEVSRRHLDCSARELSKTEEHNIMYDEGHELAEQALLAQLHQAASMTNVGTSGTDNGGLYMYSPDVLQPDAKRDRPIASSAALITSPLIQTASAGDGDIEQAQSDGSLSQHAHATTTDLQLDSAAAQIHPQLNNGTLQPAADAENMVWNPTISSENLTSYTVPVRFHEASSGLGLHQKKFKSKSRGRFSDTRRIEVQEIRKRGACIRCRMLKKPCSEGTPCNTCRNVESARLWKGTCLRTKLADEFTLWSLGLFHSRASTEVPAAVHGLDQLVLPGRMEARFFPGSNLCLTFAVKQHGNIPYAYQVIDPSLKSSVGHSDSHSRNIWLLDEGEGMSHKIEAYINEISHECKAECPFLEATLARARQQFLADQAEELASTQAASTRSCYNLQTLLLNSCMELWIETRILSAPDNSGLSLRYEPAKSPQHQPEQSSMKHDDNTLPPSSHSYRLIRSQLLAAMESRCSQLAKNVMNELERRLLQRQQVSRFATFLSAVLLLNCVERMTGFYRAFDRTEDIPKEQTDGQQMTSDASSQAFPPNWPLSDHPSTLWPQGQHFAELLIMLLRMRALPPKTTQAADGSLGVVQDYSHSVNFNGNPVKERIDEQTRTAAEWLDPIRLKVSELMAKRDEPVPNADAASAEWDMRFIAKVLLPDRVE